jgi:hypothetical protein
LAEIIARHSRQTPVAKIPRLRRTEGENRLTASARAPKSPPRIDITPQHPDTPTHDHQNHLLHA